MDAFAIIIGLFAALFVLGAAALNSGVDSRDLGLDERR
jgi:hypothetical protein